MARAPITSKAAKAKSITKSTQKSTTKSAHKTITKKAAKLLKKVIAVPSTSSMRKPSLSRKTESLGNDHKTDDRDIADQAPDEAADAIIETATSTGSHDVVQQDAFQVVDEAVLPAAPQVTTTTSLFVPPAARTHPTCFLDLPPELRNEIYKIALKEPLRQSIDKMKVPALVQAHEQIRKEAMSMFLHINTFKLVIVVQSMLRGYRLSYCCSDGKLRGLGLGSGYITNLQISIKDTGFASRSSTWKVALSKSEEVTCSGKYLDGRHEYKAANVSRKIEQYISQWLEGKAQRGGLGLEEVWSLLSVFKMELVDAVMG